MILIRLILEAFLKGGGGKDWRFCLVASLLLVEIAKNNITKGDTVDSALPSIATEKECLFLPPPHPPRLENKFRNSVSVSKFQFKVVMLQIAFDKMNFQ